jgi:HindVP restriction endonuclease
MVGNLLNPGLFGLEFTNRDFTKSKYWGKNQFNSSFPASLACYMHSIGINPVYLSLDLDRSVKHSKISLENLFGLPPLTDRLHFAFETVFSPYSIYAKGTVPRADLVTIDRTSKTPQLLRALEVKLTALPDNTTYKLIEQNYGCEIVVRPDTIVYLALGLAQIYKDDRDTLAQILGNMPISDWEEIELVLPWISRMAESIDLVLTSKIEQQIPFLIQPIWKTNGKSQVLAEQCFDLFVWSDFGFTRLFTKTARLEKAKGITRNARSVVWLYKMLSDFAANGAIDFKGIIDRLTYNTKNDKAFAVSGMITNTYMSCPELTTPRIHKDAIKEIILGGGQKFLSPERRLDAAILNTPGLFDDTAGLFIDSTSIDDSNDIDNEND